ncbi:hypothetical protein [Methylotuvimicrobium sp.]
MLNILVVQNRAINFFYDPLRTCYLGQGRMEYVALFIFDEDGNLKESKVDSFGPRDSLNVEACKKFYLSRLEELGDVKFCRIEVKPFSVNKFGVDFGLIPREPEDEEDEWAVELLPGNYMAFFEPWDSGEYDT